MNRFFPHPILTLALTLFWLILQQRFSLGQLLLGLAIGLLAGFATRILGLEKPAIRRPWSIVSLAFVVTVDIIRSNIAVAYIVLTQSNAPQSAGFLRVPLRLRNRTALAFLAVIVTSTPGTVWLEYDEDAGVLLLHILDLVDEAAWIEIITGRYERRLLEIFA